MAGKGAHEVSLEERVNIEKMIKDDFPMGRIAKILGRSHSCIKQEVLKNGKRANYSAQKAHDAYLLRQEAKRRKIRKYLSAETEAAVLDAIQDQKSMKWICDKYGITYHLLKRYLKENNLTYHRKNYAGVEDRLFALENQMKIVIEQLGEIYESKKQL